MIAPVDLVGADRASNGIKCLHWLYRDAVDVNFLDPRDLLKLIVRD